jgi:hypothetical protein
MALTPNTTTGTGQVQRGTLDQASVDAVDLLHKFEIYNEYLNRYQEDKTIINWLEETKREAVTDATVYYHYEKNWINPKVLISAKANGTGSSVILTVPSDSAVRVTNLVFFGRGELFGYITAISAPTGSPATVDLTVIPAGSSNLQAGVIATDYLNAYSNAQEEGSSSMTGLKSLPIMFSGKTQIIRSYFDVTGTEATNKVTIKMPNGEEYYMYDQRMNEHIRFKQNIALSFLINPAVSTLTNAGGNDVRVTKGLIQTIRENGIAYANPNTWSVTDFYNLNLALDAERGAKENMFYYGNQLGYGIAQSLTNVMKNGAIQYNAFGNGKDKQRAIDLGFESVRVGDYTYHLAEDSTFKNPQVLAMPGSTYPNKGYIVPADSQNDAVSGAKIPSVQLRYKAAPSENRKYKTWTRDITIDGVDKIRTEELFEGGLEVFGANRMIIVE